MLEFDILSQVDDGRATARRARTPSNHLALIGNALPRKCGLATYTSHVADSFDIVANEYSSTVAEDDARIRAVEELRRDIVTRLALFMQRRAAGTA